MTLLTRVDKAQGYTGKTACNSLIPPVTGHSLLSLLLTPHSSLLDSTAQPAARTQERLETRRGVRLYREPRHVYGDGMHMYMCWCDVRGGSWVDTT